MSTITTKTAAGADGGPIELDDAVFGIEPNVPVMHQVVTAQLAARRSGTQSTKTRAEVRGGGAKPWKQKGTGRARQGSIRSPQWKGGGVALGPKPRSYAQRTPKKMIRLALRSALSDRAAEDKVIVVDDWGFEAPTTKGAIAALAALGLEGRVLLVLEGHDDITWKSFRNLGHVHIIEAGQLNAYDVLVSDYVVFSREALPTAEGEAPRMPRAKTTPEPRTPKPPRAAKVTTGGADSATVPATGEVPSDVDSTEADDMASDLPNRPPADPSKKSAPILPTDRVKSAADKPDPRFEAARAKVANQEAMRAKAAKADAPTEESDDADSDDSSSEPTEAPKPAGFSFSKTTPEEDR